MDGYVKEVPLDKGMAIPSCIRAWRIPRTEKPWGCKESNMTEQLTHTHTHTHSHTLTLKTKCYTQYQPYFCVTINIYTSIKKKSQPKGRELCFIQWEFLGLQAQEIAS